MLGPSGRIGGLHQRVSCWVDEHKAADGTPLSRLPNVLRVLGEIHAHERINELLNWQVSAAAEAGAVDAADASVTKVFGSEAAQRLVTSLEEIVARYGDPADPDTEELLRWLDVQAKRNLVLTFGGGVNEIQRELICSLGMGLPRVPR